MDNYKIKVKDEAESKEAQELFEQLGFEKTGFTYIEIPCFLATWEGGFSNYDLDSLSASRERKELTFPQLRDLVVLKRNDVKDATHTGTGDSKYYVDSNGDSYIHNSIIWTEWKLDISILKPINKPQDPTLISGAEALRALADGKDVQVSTEFTSSSWHDDTATYTAEEILAEETAETDDYNSMKLFFRLKPQTIKLELELPKPFEPKNGEDFYYLDCTSDNFGGWAKTSWRNIESDAFKNNTAFGAWRTEEEIKQVVEQLRKIRGTNS